MQRPAASRLGRVGWRVWVFSCHSAWECVDGVGGGGHPDSRECTRRADRVQHEKSRKIGTPRWIQTVVGCVIRCGWPSRTRDWGAASTFGGGPRRPALFFPAAIHPETATVASPRFLIARRRDRAQLPSSWWWCFLWTLPSRAGHQPTACVVRLEVGR